MVHTHILTDISFNTHTYTHTHNTHTHTPRTHAHPHAQVLRAGDENFPQAWVHGESVVAVDQQLAFLGSIGVWVCMCFRVCE
jgi:hypothetical protein